ncbi:MAG: amino-acid N-acetyltransferase [Verrucomicrobiales bacterium]|jgi:amino-acid N-acetyltransferase
MRFGDLREILQYVPQFRGCVFVIAIDGAVIASSNFANILLDLAVLHSLKVSVVLVHGAGLQIQQLAKSRGITLSTIDGTGATTDETLEVSLDAISRLSSTLMQKLTSVGLRVANANVLKAHPAGVLRGVDHLRTGKIDRVDSQTLKTLIADDIVPLVAPLGFDALGDTLRLNSDAAAAEIGIALKATKIIYLSGSSVSDDASSERLRQLSVAEARERAATPSPSSTGGGSASGETSKLNWAAKACVSGVARVHILDGNQDDALLAELFSNEGVGTMVYADVYQLIRPARLEDVTPIASLVRQSIEDDELLQRNHDDVVKNLSDYFVLEVDGNLIATVSLHIYSGGKQAEIGCLYVHPVHSASGHGSKMIAFAEKEAIKAGVEEVFALSTQAVEFFRRKASYQLTDPSRLPEERREKLEQSGRKSKVLVKALKVESVSVPS